MKIRTQLITGFSVLTALAVFIQMTAFQSFSDQAISEKWVSQSNQVIANARLIEKLMLDMETGMRGFLMTGQEIFLEPHLAAHTRYEATIKELQDLVKDNPDQVKQLSEIKQMIDTWHETISVPRVEELRDRIKRSGSIEAAMSQQDDVPHRSDLSLQGKNLMDELRRRMDAFIAVENNLLRERRQQAGTEQKHARFAMVSSLMFFLLFGVVGMVLTIRSLLNKVGGEPDDIAELTVRIGNGDLNVDVSSARPTGIMAAVIEMQKALKTNQEKITRQSWLSTSLSGLSDVLRGAKEPADLCNDVTSYLARQLDLQVGTFSLADEEQTKLVLTGSYAYKQKPDSQTEFRFGEGLAGQAAQDKKPLFVEDVPGEYLAVSSGLGETLPSSICCLPLLYEDHVEGVVEIGSLHPLSQLHRQFLEQAAEPIAIAIHTARSREKIQKLLEESQAQSEELQAQSEELQA
ncbi:MAG: CHASE3 domain-containing protein, partial [Pontiellaceae bacterium]|nr:CHASE3 domain-containing protein [Pontiellaceae bacterium]